MSSRVPAPGGSLVVVLGLAVVAAALLAPRAALADCITRMSRIPMGGPRASATPPLRAHMLRLEPGTTPKRPPAPGAPRKARSAGSHPPRRRTPLLHRLRQLGGRSRAPRHIAAAPTPPTVDAARAQAAVPGAYALIRTTVCEGGPAAAASAEATPSYRLESLLAPSLAHPPATPSADHPVLPPLPPGVEPQVVGPLTPPVSPPGPGPELGPPPLAPPTTSPVSGAPEPAAWALLMAGFGLLGLALRRRRGRAPV